MHCGYIGAQAQKRAWFRKHISACIASQYRDTLSGYVTGRTPRPGSTKREGLRLDAGYAVLAIKGMPGAMDAMESANRRSASAWPSFGSIFSTLR